MVWTVRRADGAALGNTDSGWSGVERRGMGTEVGRRSRAGNYRWRSEWHAVGWALRWADARSRAGNYTWWVEWRVAPWYGHLGGQTELRWELQMAVGVEWSAVGRTVRWADGAALGSTDGGRD